MIFLWKSILVLLNNKKVFFYLTNRYKYILYSDYMSVRYVLIVLYSSMFIQMNNIDVNKEDWIKSIRKIYSAVNELIEILGKDIAERGYDKEKLEKKVQAYANYLGDTQAWDALIKWKNKDKDKDLLFDKVQDDVSNIVFLSTSKDDADNARKALRQLSDVTSADVVNVLRSCIDDGWKVGKRTRYAKKKLIMNNVSSIYEKEETNNWVDLYYNFVHWKYQVLYGDKIYTTKRESSEKKQEHDSHGGVKVEETGDAKVEQIDENPMELEGVEITTNNIDDAGNATEQHEKFAEQFEQPKMMDEQKFGKLEDEIEWSEENIIAELKKIQDMEWYEELKRCNSVEFSFLAQQLLRSPKAVDLLKIISKENVWNKERLNDEFRSILLELSVWFMVNTKDFDEWAEKLKVKTTEGEHESFGWIKLALSKGMWINYTDLNNLKTISEYIAFISCINNVKNSVIDATRRIKWTKRWSLMSLINMKKSDFDIYLDIEKRLIKLLCEKLNDFENLKEEKSSKKMKELEDAIKSDFNLLISKNDKGEYSLAESVKKEVIHLIKQKNEESIGWLICLFLPVFIKMWIFAKNNSDFAHNRFEYIDASNFACKENESLYNITDSVIKYVINWKVIELKISKLKDFGYTTLLKRHYYHFKNVVLYAIYKSIMENNDWVYGVELEPKEDTENKPSLVIYDVCTRGQQFFEDSHYDDSLQKIFEEDLEINNDNSVQLEPIAVQEKNKTDGNSEVNKTQLNGEEDMFSGDDTVSIDKRNLKEGEEKYKVKCGETEGEKKKGKKKKVNERKENVEKSIMVDDIIDFYVKNDGERERLKSLKKNGKRDQRDCPMLRGLYKIKISKPDFKKWVSFGLVIMADIVWEKIGKKIGKPCSEPWFKALFEGLKKIIIEKLEIDKNFATNEGRLQDVAVINDQIKKLKEGE